MALKNSQKVAFFPNRRAFLALGALALTPVPAGAVTALAEPSGTDPAVAAACRIGNRLRARASAAEIASLRTIARGWRGLPALASLRDDIASDHRAGRIQRIDNVSFSRTEAAWFLAVLSASSLALS